MNRRLDSPRHARFSTFAGQSERTILLGAVLLLSAFSVALSYILTQFSVDVLSSLLNVPEDCWLDWHMNIGRHCFSDYTTVVSAGLQPNPWTYEMTLPWGDYAPLRIGGPGAAFLPHLLFGFPAALLGVPRLGLIGYLLALTVAVLSPAIWAARGARGLERVVVFVALGAAAIPVWAVIDRGNSAGFIAPIALVFLVSLRRRHWRLAAIMVILAALIKLWFVVLLVPLLAARQWRAGTLALGGVVITNFAAYLLWPRDFPQTIKQSIDNLSNISGSFNDLVSLRNVSFGRGFVLLPDTFEFLRTGGKMDEGFLAAPRSLFGYVVLIVVVVCVLALGRRIPPVMAGIAMLATATLFPPLAYYYYLVFVLPIAALIVRDPEGPPGSGIFDGLSSDGVRRRAVGLWVSLATALSIAQIAIPGLVVNAPIFGQLGERGVIGTTPVEFVTSVIFLPFLWLIACAAILISYARKPVQSHEADEAPPREDPPDAVVSATPSTIGPTTQTSPQGEP
ncbi:glycosyltransferase family 87 protein [Mycobacterium sp. 2YAF39]|uniref:glycosyltransferase family 87 protein n=1 Tax=Mycobacterium sp. 2YAF39 TaxID=3233033 RepID=UPI003F9B7D03